MWEGIAGKDSKLKTKLGQNYGAICMPDYRIWTIYGEPMVYLTHSETRLDLYWKLPPETMSR